MIQDTLKQIGISKNETDVYCSLLEIGESTVTAISENSGVHRRNVYDVLNRLLEKGLVFIVLEGKEQHYQAVNPNKLVEFVQEEKNALEMIMPDLTGLAKRIPAREQVMHYRGIEGWKRYVRDIARIGKDVHVFGGRYWKNKDLKPLLDQHRKNIQKNNITLHLLFDPETKKSFDTKAKEIFKDHSYRFMPDGFHTPSAVDVFGDHTVISSHIELEEINDETVFTVIVNQEIADAFRVWHALMWGLCSH